MTAPKPPTFRLTDDDTDGERRCDLQIFCGDVTGYDYLVTIDEERARDLIAQLTAWLDAPRLAARDGRWPVTAPADLDAVRAALGMATGGAPFNASARVALDRAAPAIAAAVEELTAARAEIAALRRQVCRLTSGDEIEGDRLCQHHGADVAALAQVARYQAAAVAVATEIGGPLGPVDDDPEERAAAFVRFAESLAGRVRERVEALEADLGRALHRERRAGDESGERLREMAELLIKDANNE